MTHQRELERQKYRNWVRGGLAYKYLKEGIEGFADDVVQQEHSRILSGVIHTHGLTCNQCLFRNLRPSHKCVKDPATGKNKCPWDQSNCNCLYPKKRACPHKVCDVIMEEILKSHGSAPPSPNWKNTDIQKWCSSPWEVAKCHINTPGYSDKTRAADIDTAGLLHVFINNINLQTHLSDSMNGSNIFQKTLQRRNELFHSPTMEMEDSKLDECIEDIIAILEDDKELKARHDAQQAVCKLKQLKQEDFIITTHNEVEVCRAALASITKKSEELKQSIKDAKVDIDMKQAGATKAIDDKMQVALQNALEALAKHSDIEALKRAVELLNKRMKDLESENSTFRQELSLIKQRLTIIENDIDKLEAARGETTKKLKYVEEKKALQNGLVKLYQKHYVKTSISPLNPRENDVNINEVYVSPQMAVDVQRCTDRENRTDRTRTPERKYIYGYREIFETKGQRNKTIYIVGDVGTGKSSFCKMMIQNWCSAFTDSSINNVAYNDNSTEPGTGDTDDDTHKSDTSDSKWSPVSTLDSDDNPKEPGTNTIVTDGDTDESDTSDSGWSQVSSPESESDDDAQYSDGKSSDASAENINEMRKFDFLFFIPLQKMSRYTEITEMVSATSANLTSRDMIENIFRHDSERCLILVDGLDEWTPRQQEYHLAHVTFGLPDTDKTKQATCVTLSRPSAKGILNMKSSEYDHKVELSGIAVKSVKVFVEKYLSKFDKTNVSSKAFMANVRLAKLKHLQKTPLLLQQLLWLFCSQREIGTSVSDTYSHLLNTILRWAENRFELEDMTDRIGVTTEGKDMQLPRLLQRFPSCETNERFLLTLSRVAFETLTSERGPGTFGRSYLRKKGVSTHALSTLIKSGILVEDNCFDPTNENTQLEFIHQSYLEFFAAVHVSCHSNEDQQTKNTLKDVFLKCKSAADILQLSNILKMICGLSPSLIPELSKYISDIVSRDDSMISYRNSNCQSAQEMYIVRLKQRQIQRLILNCLSECDSDDKQMASLCDVSIDPYTEMSFLQRIIPEYVLSLYVDDISDEEVWRWIAGLKQLQYMYIDFSFLSHSEMILLSSLIQEAPLKCLSLYWVSCTQYDCENHNIDLSKHDQLQKLQLKDCDRWKISKINTKRLEILWLDPSNTNINLLLNASRLTELRLGCYFTKYTKQMNYVVHTLQQLKELGLYFVRIDHSALTVTPLMRNLQRIELKNVSTCLQTWCSFIDSLRTLQQSVHVDTENYAHYGEIHGDGRNYVRQNKMFEVIKDDCLYFSFRSKK